MVAAIATLLWDHRALVFEIRVVRLLEVFQDVFPETAGIHKALDDRAKLLTLLKVGFAPLDLGVQPDITLAYSETARCPPSEDGCTWDCGYIGRLGDVRGPSRTPAQRSLCGCC
ncbi:hypothetical protein N656DRAFT_157977 [Canariomyces notabilis]|uniref:Uncharacterized protein n=1 Tax=Canariomyces notabilis TaxID=2074819 RepID=A0AAN6YQB5_9PEZI|nr:hypothetical protein N656DRAFT_157977 [Canariomyces arenarius]